jgi:hypothetical protein
MIDTIIFEVHDLEFHADIVEQLRKNKRKHFKQGLVLLDDAFNLEDNRSKKLSELFNEGSVPMRLFHTSITPKSSHRSIACDVNLTGNFIRFNFSIPKLIYGHNVSQFIPTHLDFNSNGIISHILADQKKGLYNRTFTVIKNFFKTYFNTNCKCWNDETQQYQIINPLDWKKTKMKRFDLCYNLIHASKDDAMKHLDLLEKVKKRYSRGKHEGGLSSNKTGKAVYDTGLTHASDLFYFKIYHKGTEFRKNDAKELRKINRKLLSQGKAPKYNIDFLAEEADKILRFELEFKVSTLNYLHKSKLFRERCPNHKKDKAIYQELRRKSRMSYLKIHKLFNFHLKKNRADIAIIKTAQELKLFLPPVKSIINTKAKKMSGEVDKMILHKKDREFLDNYEKMHDLTTNFWFNCPNDESGYYHEFKNPKDFFNESKYEMDYYFKENLMNLCIDKFISLIENFRIEQVPSTIRLQKNLEQLNEKKGLIKDQNCKISNYFPTGSKTGNLRIMQTNRIMSVILLLESGLTLDEIKLKMSIPKSTFYRLKSDLKEIGYTTKMQNFTLPVPAFDYKLYLLSVQKNPNCYKSQRF